MKKMLFVMNPYAGQRKANKSLPEIVEVFNRHDYQVTIHMTAGPGDGAAVVEKLAKDMDLVVCAGGDGTFNETVTGLQRAGVDCPVGYIPCGSTNDFAASLSLSSDVVQAAKDIVEGEPCLYDVGKFEDRYFSYVASFGAFTKASYATPQSVKNALGHTAYILEGITELTRIRKEHVRMELDDRVIEDDFIFGAISNSTSVGGILTLAPSLVDMCDGKFEILLVRAPKDILELGECIRALQTQTYNCSMITFCPASRVKIQANPDMAWTLDGEREDGHAEITVENLCRAVRVMKRRAQP